MSTKRSIPFEFFAPNQFMYFDLGRLAALERETGAPVLNVMGQIEESNCSISFIIAACRAGLAHHYSNKPGVMEAVLEKYLADGGLIFDPNFLGPINRALFASGLLGKKLADIAIKNELDTVDSEEITDVDEKNAETPASE